MQDQNWKRVSRDEHCPICGKPDWCTVTADGMIACCMRVEAEKQAANGGWIHSLSDTPSPFVVSYAPTNQSNPKAEPTVLDKVYSQMLNRLTLSEGHREELLSPQRGMTIEQIKTNAYRSLPSFGRSQVAKDLLQIFEVDKVTHVPGFYLNDNGHGGYYPTLAGACGLLIPIRDVQRRIIACQIKVEKTGVRAVALQRVEERAVAVRPQSTIGKYTWFSSKGKEGGTSSGAPAHVASPSSLIDKKRVWITEGALKADIACELLGEIVVGVSGVSNWRSGNVLNILEQLDAFRIPSPFQRGSGGCSELRIPMEVVIAYDADKDKNPHVKHHAFQLACACSTKGYTVYQATWDLHKGKGIDDLLLNNEIPTINLVSTKNRIQKLDSDFMREVIAEGVPSQGSRACKKPWVEAWVECEAYRNHEASRNQRPPFRQGSRRNGAAYRTEPAEVTSLHASQEGVGNASHAGESNIPPRPDSARSLPLQEARQNHYEQIRALIENHKKGIHAFTSVVGTGKTSGAIKAIKDLVKEGKWPTVKRKRQNKKTGKFYDRDEPLRVVFVTDNHAAYQQWIDSELQEIIEVQKGRSPDEKSQWYCERFQECHNYGAKRHNPMVDVCQECLMQHGTLVGDRLMEYWKCPYLLSMDRVKAAKVVFTSKASIFNASQELKDFDVIIVDEDLFSSLWEIITFNTYNLNDYLSGMDVIQQRRSAIRSDNQIGDFSPIFDDFRVFINLLKEVMATPVHAHNWLPAVPLMKQIAEKNNIELKKLLSSLMKIEVPTQTQRYEFEEPFSLHDGTIYPIRLLRDLLALILEEIDRPSGESGCTTAFSSGLANGKANTSHATEGVGHDKMTATPTSFSHATKFLNNADTRIWLTIEGIKLYRKRQHLIDIIKRGKCVINLDATPNILLNMMFEPFDTLRTQDENIQFYHYDVEEYLTVTQVTNSLYTQSNIKARDYANLYKINDCLESITKDAALPVIFSHKAFDPQVKNQNVFSVSNQNARYGHFDYETRAQNGYADTDLLCIVGHFSKPISHLRALAQAVRNSEKVVEKNNPTEETLVGASTPFAFHNSSTGQTRYSSTRYSVLRPYWYRNKDGAGFGRWCQADPDHLVQELILQSEHAIYTQAIGRGRAALRSAENPLNVYLITATPIDSLRIDELVRLHDLSKGGAPSAYSNRGKLSTATPADKPNKEKFYARRDELNQERKQTAYQKVFNVIKRLLAEGKKITLDAIEKLSGVKRTLIAKLRKEILENAAGVPPVERLSKRSCHKQQPVTSLRSSAGLERSEGTPSAYRDDTPSQRDACDTPSLIEVPFDTLRVSIRSPSLRRVGDPEATQPKPQDKPSPTTDEPDESSSKSPKIKMGILSKGGVGVTTVGYNINLTPQWTPPSTLDNQSNLDDDRPLIVSQKQIVSCDNFDDNPDDIKISNENITVRRSTSVEVRPLGFAPEVDLELAEWAYKKHGFSFENIIKAYKEGFCLKEPITIREGVTVSDFCGFVEKRFSQIKDLDFRLPRLKGAVLRYANNLRVEAIEDLSALSKSS